MFAPFRYRDFRVYWSSVFVQTGALWLETAAYPALILELTDSALWLGALLAAWTAPSLLLSPLAGLIIDRLPYQRVLIDSFAANLIAAAILVLLLIFGLAEAWMVIALATLSGVGLAFFRSALLVIIPAIVEQPQLRAAIALTQVARAGMRIGGALLAGALLWFADITDIFGLVAALYMIGELLVLLIRTREAPRAPRSETARVALSQIAAGARWAAQRRWPLVVLAFAACMFMFLYPLEGVMAPLMVIDELNLHESWIGYMIAINGFGATLGSLWLAGKKEIRSPNALMVVLVIVAGLSLMLIGLAPHLVVLAVGVFVASACLDNLYSLGNAALLAHAPRHLRGQAMALMNVVLGTTLFGALLAGVLAESLGPSAALLTMGACLIGCAVVALSIPPLRWWLWRRQTFVVVTRDQWLRSNR